MLNSGRPTVNQEYTQAQPSDTWRRVNFRQLQYSVLGPIKDTGRVRDKVGRNSEERRRPALLLGRSRGKLG